MVGNILADFSKGLKSKTIPPEIARGIAIHRKIDTFTDSHAQVHITKQRLQPDFGHYSPVIADVFYDHFLAKNWDNYSDIPLEIFANTAYHALKKHRFLFPLRFQHALVYGRFKKVLISYQHISGIDKTFNRMLFRTKFDSNLKLAAEELGNNYNEYEKDFFLFFPELINYVRTINKEVC